MSNIIIHYTNSYSIYLIPIDHFNFLCCVTENPQEHDNKYLGELLGSIHRMQQNRMFSFSL